MLGLTDFVIVIVINAIDSDEKRSTNFFEQVPSIKLATRRIIYTDTRGNPHRRSNIQKQAYPSDKIQNVHQAYGLTGTNFTTHTPYKNGKQLSLNDNVNRFDEIILIKNGLDTSRAMKTVNVHRILPERLGS